MHPPVYGPVHCSYQCHKYTLQNITRGKKRPACSGTGSKSTTAPPKKKKANTTSAASRVSLFLLVAITIYATVCNMYT